MPSANSEKYQSKLFNFFHQKTRNWGEKVQRTLRHVKVNANWSLEAILHSTVLMMRKVVESRGKRLKPGQQPDNSSPKSESGEMQIVRKPRGAVAILDNTIATLESRAIVPFSQTSRALFASFQNQLKIFLYGQELFQKPDDNKDKQGIPQIFAQAFELFLSRKGNNTDNLRINTTHKLPVNPLPPQQSLTPNIKNPEITDTWLTLNDLFGDSQNIPPETEEMEISNANTSSGVTHWNWRTSHQKMVKKTQPETSLVEQQSSNLDINPITKNSSLSQSETTSNQLETNPKSIDTQAKLVGYAQHPLERILQLLDNGMLWLEEKIIQVFKLIKRLWQRK
ncbi:MAG: hypothetical protein HRU34_17980 [Richelia sp.]|nr:hypothetical protein [Richelia sp.]